MRDEIIVQGVELMLYGMGTVVVFLGLLVLATAAMSRLLSRYFPEMEPVPAPRHLRGELPGAGTDANVIAAISAALHRHRARRK